MRKKTICIYIILLGFSTHVYGQDFLAGMQYGVGKQHFVRSSDLQKTSDYMTQHAGLIFEFSPYFSMLYISCGVEYTFNDLGKELTFPLTFKIASERL